MYTLVWAIDHTCNSKRVYLQLFVVGIWCTLCPSVNPMYNGNSDGGDDGSSNDNSTTPIKMTTTAAALLTF